MIVDRIRAFAQTYAKDKVPEILYIPNMQVYVLTCPQTHLTTPLGRAGLDGMT